jgi:chromosome segregation ATPase
LQDEKQRASRNEDELIEEIDSLEKKLEENLLLQEQQKEDIEALSERIEDYEKALKKDEKQKTRASQAVGKRFKAIYKNITVSDRALSGFVDLNEELKIKAEEIIHQLNEKPDQVTIKRKVFIGKRDKKSIMEVIFGYKGRLYFWKGANGTVEVLAIGTKNTQSRELEYLNNL